MKRFVGMEYADADLKASFEQLAAAFLVSIAAIAAEKPRNRQAKKKRKGQHAPKSATAAPLFRLNEHGEALAKAQRQKKRAQPKAPPAAPVIQPDALPALTAPKAPGSRRPR